jgi:hypothetical protein
MLTDEQWRDFFRLIRQMMETVGAGTFQAVDEMHRAAAENDATGTLMEWKNIFCR